MSYCSNGIPLSCKIILRKANNHIKILEEKRIEDLNLTDIVVCTDIEQTLKSFMKKF